MIKKKDHSQKNKKIWEDYIKNPSDIYDKESNQYSDLKKNNRYKFDLHGYTLDEANNKVTENTIVNFTPIKSDNLSDSHVFPYKSTWITPRFDS